MSQIAHKHSFDFLASCFWAFYEGKKADIERAKSETIRESLANLDKIRYKNGNIFDTLGLTREEFKKSFVEPYQGLSGQKLIIISHLQNLFSAMGNYKIEITPIENALDWTFVNIADLDLFNIWKSGYSHGVIRDPARHMPCHQCLYCGRVDADELGTFSKHHKKWFCCVKSCQGVDGMLSEHDEKCCTRLWRTTKSNLLRRLNRNYENKNKVLELFKNFCEERYLANSANPPIRNWASHYIFGCKKAYWLKDFDAKTL